MGPFSVLAVDQPALSSLSRTSSMRHAVCSATESARAHRVSQEKRSICDDVGWGSSPTAVLTSLRGESFRPSSCWLGQQTVAVLKILMDDASSLKPVSWELLEFG
jgi:hypothetical protein